MPVFKFNKLKDFSLFFSFLTEVSNKSKFDFWVCVGVAFIGMIVEVLSLGSIVGISTLALDVNNSDGILRYSGLELSIINLSIIFFVLYSVSLGIRVLVLKINISFSHNLGEKIVQKIILKTNSYEVIGNVDDRANAIKSTLLNKVDLLVSSSFYGVVHIFSGILIIIGYMLALLYIDWKITVVSITIILIYYGVWVILLSQKINTRSKNLNKLVGRYVGKVTEALSNITELIVYGIHGKFSNEVHNIDSEIRSIKISNQFIAGLPRIWLEYILVISVLWYLVYRVESDGNVNDFAPIAVGFVFSAQRLMPSAQQVYSGWVSFLSNISTLIEVRSYLTYSDCNNLYDKKSLLNQIKEPYQTAFNGLVVSNVVFKYPNSSKEFKYNLRVRENSIVGIQGESGSGKSTLLNLIIGVFPYKRGSICLKEICQNSVFDDNWLDTISLVSQDVTLFEGTILHNIVLENPVNTKLLNEAIDIANLKDLINQKTLDYRISSSTTGANKGLSGGEKQRIGIARAIYKDSRIVVLDEATSALDKKSAVKIVNKLKILSKSKIIIMSSHDPEILKNVDNVIHISNITR